MKKLIVTLTVALIMLASVALSAPGNFHYAGKLQVNVYESSKGENVKFVIALGRKVVEFDRSGKFVWVGIDKMGGKDGWVKLSDLSKTDPDGIKY